MGHTDFEHQVYANTALLPFLSKVLEEREYTCFSFHTAHLVRIYLSNLTSDLLVPTHQKISPFKAFGSAFLVYSQSYATITTV